MYFYEGLSYYSIYFCLKIEASETEMKEGGEQTSESDPDSI